MKYHYEDLYWIPAVGLVIGCSIVFVLDYKGREKIRLAKYELLLHSRDSGHFSTSGGDLLRQQPSAVRIHPEVKEKVERPVDGWRNISKIWTGGALNQELRRDTYAANYDALALIQALLFTVSITFFTTDFDSHVLGIVCCLGNCFLWMGTLSSAFMSIVMRGLQDDEQLESMVELFGKTLLTIPMRFLMLGCLLLFLEMVFYKTVKMSAGIGSVCLAVCLVIAPIFFHTLHKLGWASAIVAAETKVERKEARARTPEEIQTELGIYVMSKGNNIMDLDRQEWIDSLLKGHRIRHTSVQDTYAGWIFDEYVKSELETLKACTQRTIMGLSQKRRVEGLFSDEQPLQQQQQEEGKLSSYWQVEKRGRQPSKDILLGKARSSFFDEETEVMVHPFTDNEESEIMVHPFNTTDDTPSVANHNNDRNDSCSV